MSAKYMAMNAFAVAAMGQLGASAAPVRSYTEGELAMPTDISDARYKELASQLESPHGLTQGDAYQGLIKGRDGQVRASFKNEYSGEETRLTFSELTEEMDYMRVRADVDHEPNDQIYALNKVRNGMIDQMSADTKAAPDAAPVGQ
jgi:hypothetical protein